MKDEALLQALEEAAARLSIKLSYEDLRKGEVTARGGIFQLRGERRIIIHKGLPVKDRADVLAEILSEEDTSGIHLPPALRERLEKARERSFPKAAEA